MGCNSESSGLPYFIEKQFIDVAFVGIEIDKMCANVVAEESES